mmetsp:Transcript_108167/g.302982  ORF Transcript_108167/g.302982 Transcript_108167/m.302982 type:complete len:257 (+) Transcript_108167:1078-1848(+)
MVLRAVQGGLADVRHRHDSQGGVAGRRLWHLEGVLRRPARGIGAHDVVDGAARRRPREVHGGGVEPRRLREAVCGCRRSAHRLPGVGAKIGGGALRVAARRGAPAHDGCGVAHLRRPTHDHLRGAPRAGQAHVLGRRGVDDLDDVGHRELDGPRRAVGEEDELQRSVVHGVEEEVRSTRRHCQRLPLHGARRQPGGVRRLPLRLRPDRGAVDPLGEHAHPEGEPRVAAHRVLVADELLALALQLRLRHAVEGDRDP